MYNERRGQLTWKILRVSNIQKTWQIFYPTPDPQELTEFSSP